MTLALFSSSAMVRITSGSTGEIVGAGVGILAPCPHSTPHNQHPMVDGLTGKALNIPGKTLNWSSTVPKSAASLLFNNAWISQSLSLAWKMSNKHQDANQSLVRNMITFWDFFPFSFFLSADSPDVSMVTSFTLHLLLDAPS
jgi:hypothetical protein